MMALFIRSILWRRLRKQSRRIRSVDVVILHQSAAWMAAYFGTSRPKDYNPPAKEESNRMLDFLSQFSVSFSRLLEGIARESCRSGRLPDIVQREDMDFAFRAIAIDDVCHELQEQQVVAT